MAYVGVTHGTTAVGCSVIDGATVSTFLVARDKRKKPRFIELLSKVVEPSDVELIAMAYSMGDKICSVTPFEALNDRGVRSLKGIGDTRGTGTAVFDELMKSGMPCVAVPGLHRDCEYLEPVFRRLYSHCGAPKKVCAAYHCFGLLRSHTKGIGKRAIEGNVIFSSISSNTVSLLIKQGKFVGGIDATAGAPGLRHGPLDVNAIRRASTTGGDANKEFFTGGIYRMAGYPDAEAFLKALERSPKKVMMEMDALLAAVAMEINGLASIAAGGKVEAVAITGSIGSMTIPFNFRLALADYVKWPISAFPVQSSAIGAAEMARDIVAGRRELMGIPVDL